MIASRGLDSNLSTWRWVGSGAFCPLYVCGGDAEKLLDNCNFLKIPSNGS
jgi:hypothetical protein